MKTIRIKNKYARSAVSTAAGATVGMATAFVVAYALVKVPIWTGIKTVLIVTTYVTSFNAASEEVNNHLNKQNDEKA